MNLNNVLTTNYVKWTLGEREKNEAKTKPNEAKLKKAKMSLTLYITRDYENKPQFQNNENEAKTKPIKPNFKPRPSPHTNDTLSDSKNPKGRVPRALPVGEC